MQKIRLRESDRLFSLWVRNRDNWTCQRCYKRYTPPTKALHCSHFHGRRKESTRFEPLNATSLCYGCHSYFTSQPAEHKDWQKERLGKDYDRLTIIANTYKKRDDKLEILYWKQRLKEEYGKNY